MNDRQLDVKEEIDSFAWFSPDDARENIQKNNLAKLQSEIAEVLYLSLNSPFL